MIDGWDILGKRIHRGCRFHQLKLAHCRLTTQALTEMTAAADERASLHRSVSTATTIPATREELEKMGRKVGHMQ